MSIIAAIGVLVLFILAVIGTFASVPGIAVNLLLNFTILGFAVSLAALLAGYRYKALSIIGMVICFILTVGWLVLILLPREPGGLLTGLG